MPQMRPAQSGKKAQMQLLCLIGLSWHTTPLPRLTYNMRWSSAWVSRCNPTSKFIAAENPIVQSSCNGNLSSRKRDYWCRPLQRGAPVILQAVTMFTRQCFFFLLTV